MPRINRLIIESGIYHIICRGNNLNRIFKKEADYEHYLYLLESLREDHKFKLYHYCLMPNHVYLMLETTKDTNLPKLMKQINLSYYFYFRRQYKYYGHFWQGRYKSMLISKDEYLLMCGRYIENNPVKAKMVKKAEKYPWSSYRVYGLGIKNELIDENPLYKTMGKDKRNREKKYKEFLKEGLKIKFNNRFLGGKTFIKKMEKKFGVKNVEKGPGRPRKTQKN